MGASHAPFETFAPWKRLEEDGPESVALETIKRFCRALGHLAFRPGQRVGRAQRLTISRPDVMLRGFEKEDVHWSGRRNPPGNDGTFFR